MDITGRLWVNRLTCTRIVCSSHDTAVPQQGKVEARLGVDGSGGTAGSIGVDDGAGKGSRLGSRPSAAGGE